jgi:protein-disulfide isomerase
MGRKVTARRRPARRSPLRLWGPVAFVVVALVAGIAFQAARSHQQGQATAPAHTLGPEGGEVLGRASAPVLVEEYGDFQCPICARWEKTVGPTVRRLVQQEGIRFVYHPIAFIGPESLAAANAAECAGDQGKFWPYHDLLFAEQAPENSGALSDARLLAFGQRVGATGQRFQQCVKDGTYDNWVRQGTDLSSQRGVTGTPAVFVDGRQVQTALTVEGLEAAVDAAARASS